MPRYLYMGIFEDEDVGFMVRDSVEFRRDTDMFLSFSVCGEHRSDFFGVINLDYISCSPCTAPFACLVASHALVKMRIANAKREEVKIAVAAEWVMRNVIFTKETPTVVQ